MVKFESRTLVLVILDVLKVVPASTVNDPPAAVRRIKNVTQSNVPWLNVKLPVASDVAAPSETVVGLLMTRFETVSAAVETVCALVPANSTVLPALNVGRFWKFGVPPVVNPVPRTYKYDPLLNVAVPVLAILNNPGSTVPLIVPVPPKVALVNNVTVVPALTVTLLNVDVADPPMV